MSHSARPIKVDSVQQQKHRSSIVGVESMPIPDEIQAEIVRALREKGFLKNGQIIHVLTLDSGTSAASQQRPESPLPCVPRQ